ncbi:hypothetical protein [Caudoviricetes sp.]|nr:hypothetical protein [Caudoviricetes sp.]
MIPGSTVHFCVFRVSGGNGLWWGVGWLWCYGVLVLDCFILICDLADGGGFLVMVVRVCIQYTSM